MKKSIFNLIKRKLKSTCAISTLILCGNIMAGDLNMTSSSKSIDGLSCISDSDRRIYLTVNALIYAKRYKEAKDLAAKSCTFSNADLQGSYLFITDQEGFNFVISNSMNMHSDKSLLSEFLKRELRISKQEKINFLKLVKKLISEYDEKINTESINEDYFNKSQTEISLLLAERESKEIIDNRDKFGNSSLIYAILTNHPEYINKTLGRFHEKNLFIKKNKNQITPMHAAFSPILKGKNLSQLNDEILKNIPTAYFINNETLMSDYFQFIENYKNNNTDLYLKIKEKFKFKLESTMSESSRKLFDSALSFDEIPSERDGTFDK